MKALGICGSPREGNTEAYIKTVLGHLGEEGHETLYIPLRLLKIAPCEGCYRCVKEGKCVIEDDFQSVFQKMVESDCLVVGSPVYNGSMTAKLKALLDRAGFSARWMKNEMTTNSAQYEWGKMVFSGKLFAPIAVARKTGQTFTLAQLMLWAQVNDFLIAGSNYWTVGHAGTSGSVNASEDSEGMSIMTHLAENLNYVSKKLYDK